MALAHYLSDGVTTLQLNDGTAGWTLDFGLSNPGPLATVAEDSHEVELLGGNATVLAAQVSLGRLFLMAKTRWQTGLGARVFYYVQLDGSTLYRSEVLSGEFVPTGERVKGEWALGRRRGRLHVVRRNWLEGAEAQISLTNDNGTDNTSGLTIYDGNSGAGSSPTKKVNWFEITAAKISGDLNAPTRIEVSSLLSAAGNPSLTLARTPAAHGVSTAFWAETFTGFTANADTTRSGDSYQSKTIGSNAELVTGANMETYFGYFDSVGFYRAYACLGAGTAGTYKITPVIRSTYGKSQYLALTTDWSYHDLGLIRFPAVTHSEGNSGYSGLYVEGMNGISLRIDYLSMTRCDMNRSYEGNFPSGLGQKFIDDGIDDLNAYYIASATSDNDYPATGDQLTLQPGYHHRIHFTGDTATVAEEASITVKLYYRPRWLSI